MIFFSVFVFLFGAVVGSFLNVVILRLNTGQSIVSGRSKCFTCAKKLKWHELLPIVSFVFLRGKCSACKTKISWQYPLVETITGIIFVLLFQQSQISNLKSQNILDFGFRILDWNALLAGFILFAFFALLWGMSKGRWMGFGDAKLALGIGWLLGITKGIAAITLAFWVGAIVGVLLIYLNKNKYGLKSSIAFGPFMILGTIISFFWGEKIIGFLF